METKIRYYAQLISPYKNKHGGIIPTSKKIEVRTVSNKHVTRLYEGYGKEAKHERVDHPYIAMWNITKANYPDDFTELDYVKKHHEIIISYGHGSAEWISLPCKLFKEITKTETEYKEI